MSDQIVIPSTNYYEEELQSFRSTIRTVYISLKEYFANLLFRQDQTRVQYSSTSYALRKRYKESGTQGLDLPFLNFRLTGWENTSSRNWWNATLSMIGGYFDEIQQKIQVLPITLSYDCTAWYNKDIDMTYATNKLVWENKTETIIRPTISVGDVTFQYYALLNLPPQWEPQYTESDWLTQNKIHSVGIQLSVETFLFSSDLDVSLPTSLLLKFGRDNNLSFDNPELIEQYVVDQENEEVVL